MKTRSKAKKIFLYSTNAILWILYGLFQDGYSICLFIPMLIFGCWLILNISSPKEELPGK